MRTSTRLLTLAAVFVLAGCRNDSVISPRSPTLLVTSAGLDAAVQDWERRTIFNDHTFFVPCLNENVRIYGYVSYQFHEVASPSGGYNFKIQYLPQNPGDPPFVAEGQTSGKVFYYNNGRPVNVSFHSAAGENQTVVVNEEYVAADKSKLIGDATFHYTVNANGDLTDLRDVAYSISCR